MKPVSRTPHRIASGAVGLFAVVLTATAVHAQAPPILAPGEKLAPLKGGCAVVLSRPDAKKARQTGPKESASYFAQFSWRGPCRFGVAHGTGDLVVDGGSEGARQVHTFVYGHDLSRSDSVQILAGKTHKETDYALVSDARRVRMTNLEAWDKPRWDADESLGSQASVADGKTETFIFAEAALCKGGAKRTYKGCLQGSTVYGVRVASTELSLSQDETIGDQITPCPDFNDPSSCNDLWNKVIGPYRTSAERTIADFNAHDDAVRKQATALYADAEKADAQGVAAEESAALDGVGSLLADNASRAQQLAAEAAATATKKAAEEAEAKKTAEAAKRAAAAQQARDDAFNAGLQKLNAGQLFVRATDMQEAGDSERARAALKALLNRFPDSALAAQAAQQLILLRKQPIVPAAATTGNPQP
jgi:hypothetical protein